MSDTQLRKDLESLRVWLVTEGRQLIVATDLGLGEKTVANAAFNDFSNWHAGPNPPFVNAPGEWKAFNNWSNN